MRGGASYSWMIMNGIKKAATTLFQVDSGIDTGDIILSKKYIFPETCRKPIDYMNFAAQQTVTDLLEFVRNILIR